MSINLLLRRRNITTKQKNTTLSVEITRVSCNSNLSRNTHRFYIQSYVPYNYTLNQYGLFYYVESDEIVEPPILGDENGKADDFYVKEAFGANIDGSGKYSVNVSSTRIYGVRGMAFLQVTNKDTNETFYVVSEEKYSMVE